MTSQTEKSPEPNFDFSAYRSLYLKEARTCLVTLRQNLVRLRDDSGDKKALREAHRAAHMLKGMSATMQYGDLAATVKPMEDLLRQAERTGETLPPGHIQTFLASCDAFEEGLKRLETEAGATDSA